jgi:Uma2 family endonuclease
MATTAGLITVAEFEKLPEQHNVRQELRHGEVVTMPPPTMRHNRAARKLMLALHGLLGHRGYVNSELPFRPLPDYEVWIADVAFLSREREANTADNEWVQGAPDLVVEVLSPSNTAVEMDERRSICIENGCRQFWVVNAERKTISVSTPDAKTITYRKDEQIDLAEFGGGELSLADLFVE